MAYNGKCNRAISMTYNPAHNNWIELTYFEIPDPFWHCVIRVGIGHNIFIPKPHVHSPYEWMYWLVKKYEMGTAELIDVYNEICERRGYV